MPRVGRGGSKNHASAPRYTEAAAAEPTPEEQSQMSKMESNLTELRSQVPPASMPEKCVASVKMYQRPFDDRNTNTCLSVPQPLLIANNDSLFNPSDSDSDSTLQH